MTRVKIEVERVNDAIRDGSIGFCLKCGAEAYNVEPDGRAYRCEECGAHQVFGAEEIALMGETK